MDLTSALELLSELARRYLGRQQGQASATGSSLPTSGRQVLEENPDLADQLRLLASSTRALFGESLSELLMRHGVMAPPPARVAPINKDEVELKLADLADELGDCDALPASFDELVANFPSYAQALRDLSSMCGLWYGRTAEGYLREIGLLAPRGGEARPCGGGAATGANESGAAAMGAAAPAAAALGADDVLSQLRRIYSSVPPAKRPTSLTVLLAERYQLAGEIRQAQRAWDDAHGEGSFELRLREARILSELVEHRAETKLAKLAGRIQWQSAETLSRLWVDVTGAAGPLVRGEAPGVIFPPDVVGIDLVEGFEVRESLVAGILPLGYQGASLAPGTRLRVSMEDGQLRFRSRSGSVVLTRPVGRRAEAQTSPAPPEECPALAEAGKPPASESAEPPTSPADEPPAPPAELLALTGATVAGVSLFDLGQLADGDSEAPAGAGLVQVRYRFLRQLNKREMLGFLVLNGVVDEDDLQGGIGWMSRGDA